MTQKPDQQDVNYKSAMEEISTLLNANVPYIWVTTYEESRFIRTLHAEITEKQNKELWTWSANQGMLRYDPKQAVSRAGGEQSKTAKPTAALDFIDEYERSKDKRGSVWVMKDFHTVLTQPVPRQLRDLHQPLIKQQKTVIILSPMLAHGPSGTRGGIEPTLEKQVSVVTFDLPKRDAINARLHRAVKHMKAQFEGKKIATNLDYTEEEYDRFATALQGLTELEVENAVIASICHLNRIDARKLLREKKQIVQRSEILEYIEQRPDISQVGGLDAAKNFFDTYKSQFTPEAKAFGVEPLKGALFTGVPGTGKSLLAKAIAALWNLPLLRLDVGKVMTGLVGGSEEKMRIVVSQVEAIAPCVLWIDEIEKSLSGTKSSNFSDGGTLARVFGTLLTSMEERMENVVVIATSNDIQGLPPELIRRFNEVLFCDLPEPVEREEIFRIHLAKRGRDADKLGLDVDALVNMTKKFTGAEIEKAVKEGIARAFRNKKKNLTQEDLEGAIRDTKPIAVVMKDKISSLREWARDKARYASSLAEAANALCAQSVVTRGGKEIVLDDELDDLDGITTNKERRAKAHDEAGGEFDRLDNIIQDQVSEEAE